MPYPTHVRYVGLRLPVRPSSGPMLATIKRLQVPSEGTEMRIKRDHYTDQRVVTAATGE